MTLFLVHAFGAASHSANLDTVPYNASIRAPFSLIRRCTYLNICGLIPPARHDLVLRFRPREQERGRSCILTSHLPNHSGFVDTLALPSIDFNLGRRGVGSRTLHVKSVVFSNFELSLHIPRMALGGSGKKILYWSFFLLRTLFL